MKIEFDPVDIICFAVLIIVSVLFGLFVMFDKKDNVPMLAEIFKDIVGLLVIKRLFPNNKKSK